jgi:hypothetical protein
LDTPQQTAAAYEEAIARVLGGPSDSIQIAPIENFSQWFELAAHSQQLTAHSYQLKASRSKRKAITQGDTHGRICN